MEATDLEIPPGPDPVNAAVESYIWGNEAYYIVPSKGQYYVWVRWPPGDRVYVTSSVKEAREFLDRQQAWFTFVTGYGDRFAHVEVVDHDPDNGLRPVFEAVMVDGGQAGVLVAARDETGENQQYRLHRFDDLRTAGEKFAATAEQFAEQVERDRLTGFPEIVAANLRYRAALARAGTLRILVGNAVRHNEKRIRGERGLVPVVGRMVGVSREFLYRVLAGSEWTSTTTLTVHDASRPTSPPAEAPPRKWEATAALTVDAENEQIAGTVLNAVLAALDVPVKGEPTVMGVRDSDRLWIGRTRLDLSRVGTLQPDDAQTSLRYLTRNTAGITWRAHLRSGHRQGRYEWPCGWESREEVLVDPAVRAAEITVAQESPNE